MRSHPAARICSGDLSQPSSGFLGPDPGKNRDPKGSLTSQFVPKEFIAELRQATLGVVGEAGDTENEDLEFISATREKVAAQTVMGW